MSTEKKFNRKVFVIDCEFEKFTREEAVAKIEELGGKVREKVNIYTSYLITGKIYSSNFSQAVVCGVKILYEEDFINLIDGKEHSISKNKSKKNVFQYKEVFDKIELSVKKTRGWSKHNLNKLHKKCDGLVFEEKSDKFYFELFRTVVFYNTMKNIDSTKKEQLLNQHFPDYITVANYKSADIAAIYKLPEFKMNSLQINSLSYISRQMKSTIAKDGSYHAYLVSLKERMPYDRFLNNVAAKFYQLHEQEYNHAYHFLMEIGFEVVKPYKYLQILFSRFGLIYQKFTPADIVKVALKFSKETGYSMKYIDTIFELFCEATENGVCQFNPRCSKCSIKNYLCQYYYNNKNKIKETNTAEIYIVDKPCGEIFFGKLDEDSVEILKNLHESDEFSSTEIVLNPTKQQKIFHKKGIFSTNLISNYELESYSKIPYDINDEDGFYIIQTKLGRYSLSFPITPKDGKPFDTDRITGKTHRFQCCESILADQKWGELYYDIIGEYYYDDELIKEANESAMIGNDIVENIYIFQVSNEEQTLIYSICNKSLYSVEWSDFLEEGINE